MADQEEFELGGEEFRRLGYSLIDSIVDHLQAESGDPVLPQVSGDQVHERFSSPAPKGGSSAHEVLEEATELIGSWSRKNGHPRFFAYVCSSGDPIGILADALASAANQNLTAWRSSPGATEMERQVVRWLDEALGFDGQGHGLLLSGGSAANAHGIACARAAAGAAGADMDKQTIYLSREAHLSLPQAARAIGFKAELIRTLAVDGEFRLDVEALENAITHDLAAGLHPACVCASSGTANTGAIDPLDEVAALCSRHDAWFHIDGAYGAPAALTDSYRHLRRGFARADSMSIDPHKWLFAPFDVGCVLVRDPAASRRAFARSSEYIAVQQEGDIESFAFFDHGPELSRRFRALKVWMIVKYHGLDGLAQEIERQIELRRHLDRRILEASELERLGSDLSISCFRYRPRAMPEGQLDALNQTLQQRLIASGRFLLSPTTLGGRYCLRICIVNFRTRQRDVDLLIDEVLRLGRLAAAGDARATR